MPKKGGRLSARFVATVERPGRYVDGFGLLLAVKPTGAKSWVFRYQRNGRRREIGLGPASIVSLAEARRMAAEMQRMLLEGRDPLAEKRRARTPPGWTFREAAEAYLAAHRPSWRNPAHRAQWESTLRTYAFPAMGDVPVRDVELAHVLAALEPIWRTKTETAKRLRGRIEAILDWAAARGLREGPNPARWRGHLDKLLPAPSRISRVRHFPALPWPHAPAFFAELGALPGVAPAALAFLILTATRSSEVRGARWREIDPERAVWEIPEERTKSRRPHRVPLVPEALALLERVRPLARGPDSFVFPGLRDGRPLSGTALSAVIDRMNAVRTAAGLAPWADAAGDVPTVHGFRSTFRTWAAEATPFPRELAEAALGHVVGDRVERAYARGDLFARRRRLMEAWAAFLGGGKAEP